MNTNCNNGIVNNDQGYFRNNPASQITNSPSFNLALISNYNKNDKTPDVSVFLNTINLSWNDFTALFFKSPSGAFYINPANNNVSAVSFSSQTYKTTYNKFVMFNLADQVKKAWSKKNNLPESSIPTKTNLDLERQTFLTKSLGYVCGESVGLSYDEMLSSLLGTGTIEVGSTEDFANINFQIEYQYYFAPLDINLATVFTYNTNIPCFKNTVPFCCDCNPYSNDTKTYDRANFDLNDNMSIFSDFETKNNEEYSVASNYSSVNTNLMTEISKIINNNVENVDSNQW